MPTPLLNKDSLKTPWRITDYVPEIGSLIRQRIKGFVVLNRDERPVVQTHSFDHATAIVEAVNEKYNQ